MNICGTVRNAYNFLRMEGYSKTCAVSTLAASACVYTAGSIYVVAKAILVQKAVCKGIEGVCIRNFSQDASRLSDCIQFSKIASFGTVGACFVVTLTAFSLTVVGVAYLLKSKNVSKI